MNWKDLVRDMWDGERRQLSLPIDILHTNIITQSSRTWYITSTIDVPTAKRYQLKAGDKQAELMLRQVTDELTEITIVPPKGSIATDESDLLDFIAGALWGSNNHYTIRLQKAQGEPPANQAAAAPAQPELQTMQIQSPAPTDAPKTTNWSRDQITFALLIGGFFLTLFACIAAWLVVPQVQEVISSFVRGAIPTLTPTLVSPTAAP